LGIEDVGDVEWREEWEVYQGEERMGGSPRSAKGKERERSGKRRVSSGVHA
jgi:hypothetical protein